MDTRETISNFTSTVTYPLAHLQNISTFAQLLSRPREINNIKTSIIKTLKVKARTYRYREEPLQKSPTSCWLVDETRRTKGETRENNVSTLINRAINWKKKKKEKFIDHFRQEVTKARVSESNHGTPIFNACAITQPGLQSIDVSLLWMVVLYFENVNMTKRLLTAARRWIIKRNT